MNIVSMAMQYLTPMLIDRIAGSLGIQSPLVKTAIAAILPTILAGLTGVAAKPGGGRQLGEVLSKQNTDILGDLGSIFGGPKQAEATKSGTDALRDLLGGSAVSGLTGAVSKFAGIGSAPTEGLVGMLAPVVLGSLAKQQKESGLDAAGLAGMLMGQRQNIQAALPQGFSDLLKGTGLLDSLAPAAAPQATRPAAQPAPAPQKAGGMGVWPMVAAAAAIAVLGWYWLGGQRPAAVTLPAAPAITVGNQNIGAQLGSIAEGLRGTLATIKDEATAKSALPRLTEMSQQLAGMRDVAGRLPADGKKSLATYVNQLLPLLRPLIEKALQAAGVGPVAKPVLDQILNRIEALGKV